MLSILVLLALLLVPLVSGTNDGINAVSQQLLDACLQQGSDEDTAARVRELLTSTADKKASGININVQDPASGQTPLMASVLRGKAATVEVLLQHGADASIAEKDGYLPPHGAAFQGRTAVLKVLELYGVAQQEFHEDGYLPFHRACWGRSKGHAEFVAYMLQSGLVENIDVKSTNGRTCREMTRNPQIIEVLDEFTSSGGAAKEDL